MTEQQYRKPDLDFIEMKAAQLDALLNNMHGEGFAGFICLNDALKDSLIQLAAQLVGDIREALRDEVICAE